MEIKTTDIHDKDFLRLCKKLNTHMNNLVPGRSEVYNTLSGLGKIFYVALALEHDQVVGMAALADEPNNTAELRCLYVEPKHRGKGIAKCSANTLSK